MLVSDLHAALDGRFPFADAADWDPVGLQIGAMDRSIERVAVCHEVTEDVVAAVLDGGFTTVVSYHPVLLQPTNRLVEGPDAVGRTLRLAEGGVSVVTVHTALDAADPGTGDHLLASLGWDSAGRWGADRDDGSDAIGRFATIAEMSGADLATHVRQVLGASVRSTPPETAVEVVAVIPGSGSSFIDEAVAFADALITGDVSHHRARGAADRGLMVLDAGHAATEFAGIQALYAAVDDIVDGAVFVGDDPTPWEG